MTTSVSLTFPLSVDSSVSENRNIISSISSSSLMAVSIKDSLLPDVECLVFFTGDGSLPTLLEISDALLARKALDTDIAHWGTPTAL
jgi:hypothetical protein